MKKFKGMNLEIKNDGDLLDESEIEKIKNWGVKDIRFHYYPDVDQDLLDAQISQLIRVFDVIIAFHSSSPPDETKTIDYENILHCVIRHRHRPIGYDLLNEPRPESQIELQSYMHQFQELIDIINEIDSGAKIIIQPGKVKWSTAAAYEELLPLQGKNVIYSQHAWFPWKYTHAKVPKVGWDGDPYPVPVLLKDLLEHYWPAKKWQLQNNVRMIVGELGCTVDAPLRHDFIDQLIYRFRAMNWDWFYHGYGPAKMWRPDMPESDITDLLKKHNFETESI